MSAVSSPAASRSQLTLGAALCALSAGVAGTIIGVSLASYPDGTEGWLHAARYTARFSFLVFTIVFVARPWHQLWPSPTTRWAVRNRRSLGLAFATAHFIHLYALTRFSVLAERMPSAVTLVFGGAAYVLLAAMVATSNEASVRGLGARNWKRLHTAGMYWLWFIFFQSYGGRLAGGDVFFAGFVLVSVGGIGLRIAAYRRRRR